SYIDYSLIIVCSFFFFSSRRRHTRWPRDWSSDVCSSDLYCLLRSARAGEAILPPRLVHDQRDGVGKVQAPVPRAHRDGELPLARSEERRVGKECRSRWWPDQ